MFDSIMHYGSSSAAIKLADRLERDLLPFRFPCDSSLNRVNESEVDSRERRRQIRDIFLVDTLVA